MSVWFVFRSREAGPTGLLTRGFDDATTLDWFRRHWQGAKDAKEATRRCEEILGVEVPGFATLLQHIQEESLPVPQHLNEINQQLLRALEWEPEQVHSWPSGIEVLDIADGTDCAWYFFDDAFLAVGNSADNVTCLLRENWRLPVGQGNGFFKSRERTWPLGPPGRSACSVYLIFLTAYDENWLTDLPGVSRIDGVSLSELVRYLSATEPDGELSWGRPGFAWPFELLLLRAVVADFPDLTDALAQINHLDVAGVWTELEGQRLTGSLDVVRGQLGEILHQIHDHCHTHAPRRDPNRSLVQVSEHLAQLCLHEQILPNGRECYQRWILFDDYWASAQPILAHSLIRFASRWNVL